MAVRLVVNPSTDGDFVSDAHRHLVDGAKTPDLLESRLRERYPGARVSVGIEDGLGERWYVYREGRWVNETPRRRMTTARRIAYLIRDPGRYGVDRGPRVRRRRTLKAARRAY